MNIKQLTVFLLDAEKYESTTMNIGNAGQFSKFEL